VAKKSRPVPVSTNQIERRIHVVRGQRVMLDSDLAEVYQTTTMALNQAVKRNRKRFPDDFAFLLTQQEFNDLKSQSVISSSGHGGRRNPPWVFTEYGVTMLASVLHSRIAVQVSIEIVRVFVRLRRLLATPGELAAQRQKLAETVQLHDEQIKVIAEVLRKLMEPPPSPAERTNRFSMAAARESSKFRGVIP
jgi:hypothetical protein